MKQILEEVVSKAVDDPNSYTDLTIKYNRGHDLSGVTYFEVGDELSFLLSSNNPRKDTSYSYSGRLTFEQRRRLLMSIQDSSFFDISSSMGNIGDDEIPITIEVSHADASYRLEIWQRDARKSENYRKFDSTLSLLLMELSEGNIKR